VEEVEGEYDDDEEKKKEEAAEGGRRAGEKEWKSGDGGASGRRVASYARVSGSCACGARAVGVEVLGELRVFCVCWVCEREGGCLGHEEGQWEDSEKRERGRGENGNSAKGQKSEKVKK
jgi:hypothetical protein